MCNLLIFSFLLGLIAAYILHFITKRLLFTYTINSSAMRFYAIVMPILFFILGLHYDSLKAYLLGSLFLCLLTITAVMDYYTLEVRHRFILFIGLVGLCHPFLIGTPSFQEMFIGFFAASLPFLIISIVTHGGIGGGDIKLLASCGLVMGYQNVLLGTFLGIILGGFYGILLLLQSKKNRKDTLPFVPFLSIGLAISYLWGDFIIDWYLGLIFHL